MGVDASYTGLVHRTGFGVTEGYGVFVRPLEYLVPK